MRERLKGSGETDGQPGLMTVGPERSMKWW